MLSVPVLLLYLWKQFNVKMKSDGHLTENAHVISATLLGFLNNCGQCVRKVLEQGILLLDLHAQNTVQELPHVVVICSKRYALHLCENVHKTVQALHFILHNIKLLKCHLF